jgi:hypothetical protein
MLRRSETLEGSAGAANCAIAVCPRFFRELRVLGGRVIVPAEKRVGNTSAPVSHNQFGKKQADRQPGPPGKAG